MSIQSGYVSREIYIECSNWYLHESDTRGYDPQLGWLHTIAHGADCLGVCVETAAASCEEVLTTLAKRVMTPGYPWLYNEPARLVAAVVRSLTAAPDTCIDAFFEVLNKASELDLRKDNNDMEIAGCMTNRRAVIALLYAATSIPVIVDGKAVVLPQPETICDRRLKIDHAGVRTKSWTKIDLMEVK